MLVELPTIKMSILRFIFRILPPKLIRTMQEKAVQSQFLIKIMFKVMDEETLLYISNKLAFFNFKTAARRVPAYKNFLEARNIKTKKIKKFKDFVEKVPLTDKKSYLLHYNLNDLCMDGNLYHKGIVNRSSGYTGNPIYFVLKEKENYLEEKCIGNWIAANFNLTPEDLIVNCLLLGSWVGGIRSGNAGRYAGPVINVGPRVKEAVDVITDIGKYYKRIVISAYPPFALTLIAALQDVGFDFEKKPMLFFTGGEGFDEEFRNNISFRTKGNAKIYSAYGSAETGVRVANETDDIITLRRMLVNNPELCEKLFGKNYPPNLFQYDPTYVHVLTNKREDGKQELVFTTLSDKLMPVIKYNLKDEGGIYTQKELNALLKQYVNFEIKFKLPLPILYMYGRSDGTLSFIGSNIYPQQIKAALAPYQEYIEDFKVEVTTNEDMVSYLLVHILARDKKKIDTSAIEQRIFNALNTFYFPYEELIVSGLAGMPVVRLYNDKNWPFEKYDPVSNVKQKPF